MESPEYLSRTSAAALLDISPTTFWRRVKDGTLPAPVYIATMPRWRRGELLAAVETATKPAA